MHSAIQAAASAWRAAQRSRDPSTLRVFLSWVRREREVAQGVEAQPPRLPRRVLDVLSRDELARLEDCARTERDKLIVRMLADTGIRVSELTGLRVTDWRHIFRARCPGPDMPTRARTRPAGRRNRGAARLPTSPGCAAPPPSRIGVRHRRRQHEPSGRLGRCCCGTAGRDGLEGRPCRLMAARIGQSKIVPRPDEPFDVPVVRSVAGPGLRQNRHITSCRAGCLLGGFTVIVRGIRVHGGRGGRVADDDIVHEVDPRPRIPPRVAGDVIDHRRLPDRPDTSPRPR